LVGLGAGGGLKKAMVGSFSISMPASALANFCDEALLLTVFEAL